MRKLLKILGWALIALAAVVVVGGIVLTLTVDPNDYRDDITRLAESQTGREVRLGNIELSLFPWLGAELEDVTVSNAEGFGEEPMLSAGEVQVRVQVLPLLRREVQLDTVVLEEVAVRLERDESGTTNWQDLLAPAKAEPERPREKRPDALAALALGGLAVRDARLVWIDRMTGQQALVENIDIESGAIAPGQSTPLSGSLAYRVSQPELSGNMAVETRLTVLPEAGSLTLDDIQLDGSAAGPVLPGAPLDVSMQVKQAFMSAEQVTVTDLALESAGLQLQASAKAMSLEEAPSGSGKLELRFEDPETLQAALGGFWPDVLQSKALREGFATVNFTLDLGRQTASVAPLKVNAAGVNGSLTAEVNSLLGQPAAHSTLQLNINSPDTFLQFLGAAGAVEADALRGAMLEAKASLDMSQGTAQVEPLSIAAAGIGLNGKATAKGLDGTPTLVGSIGSETFSPRQLLQRLGVELPELGNGEALNSADFAFGFQASESSARLKNMKVRVDESTLTGSLGAERFDPPAVTFDLALDRLNLDRYLPPSGEGAAPPGAAAAAGTAQLPQAFLRSLDIKGKMDVGALEAFGIRSESIHAKLAGEDGRFRLHPARADLYGGQYAGDVRLDVSGEQPVIAMNESLTGVNAAPLLEDVVGEAYVSGQADLSAELTARGIDPDTALRSLNGTAKFGFRNGAVQGFNLAQIVREAIALAKGQPKPPKETRKTDFTNLQGTVVVQNGVAVNRDLSAKAPLFRVDGEGQANLVAQTLDYRLNVAVVESLAGQGGAGLQEVRGLTIPLHISGPMASPDIDVAIDEALKARAKQALEKEKEALQQRLEGELQERAGQEQELKERLRKEEEKARDELKRELEEGLKGLFRR